MKSTHRLVALGVVVSLGLNVLAAGSHALPVSPPPCSPDGSCYPKRGNWGHYGTHWRPWPGANANTPAPITPEGSSLLKPHEPPRPELEEQHAPPPLETTKPEEESSETPPADTPPLNLPPLPFPTPPATQPQPQPGTPPATTPGPEGSTPPPLPFPSTTPSSTPSPSTLPFPGTESAPARPNEVPLSPPGTQFRPGKRTRPETANENDAPPTLPLHFTQRSAAGKGLAAARPTLRRLPSAPAAGADRGVVNAAAVMPASARHQAQPASYTPASCDPPPALPVFRQ